MVRLPTTLDPLKQDENSKGKPSDHNVIFLTPRTEQILKNQQLRKKEKYKTITQVTDCPLYELTGES